MGLNAAPRVLACALNDMDPHASGEIAKLEFYTWFVEHMDEIDETPSTLSRLQRQEDASEEGQSAMLNAKKQRKQIERDAQVLANRLAHLRAEDARARKRIGDAKRRAREWEAIKKRNDAKQQEKQEARQQLQRELKVQRDSNHEVQCSSRERRNTIIANLASQRAHTVQEVRAERKSHLYHIEKQREKEQTWLIERSREIRDKEKRALRLRHAVQKAYEKELVKKARIELAKEKKKQSVTKKKIDDMELQETELIEKLRLTQELHRAALEELEFVMQGD